MIHGSWSGMKKMLEQDLLCESLRGRIVYQLDVYSRYGSSGNCFTVCLDDQPVLKAGFMYAQAQLQKAGMIDQGEHVWDVPRYSRQVYDDREFAHALAAYRSQPIECSIASNDPIVRMFAAVDRRVGKRRLRVMADSVEDQPDWLRKIIEARIAAEGIRA